MKKVLFASIALLFLDSCNFEKKLTAFYKEHCPNSAITKTHDGKYMVTLECANLYETAELNKYVEKGIITYDFAGAKISGVVKTADSIPDLYKIMKGISRGIKK